MPCSLRKIDNGAFENCKELQWVSLNEGLMQLGEPEKTNSDISLELPEIEENIGVFKKS